MSKKKQKQDIKDYINMMGASIMTVMLGDIILQYVSMQTNREEVKIPYKTLRDLDMLDDTDDPDMCETYCQLILSCCKDIDYAHGWKNVKDLYVGYSIRPNCLVFYMNPKANWDDYIKDFEKDKKDADDDDKEYIQFLNNLKTVEELEKEKKGEK